MLSSIQPVSNIDRFTAVVDGFLANMVELTSTMFCDAHIAANWNGLHIPRCTQDAYIGDLTVELQFCRSCYRKFERGEFDGR